MQLGLSAKVVRPLAVLGIAEPTPIQKQAIPFVLEGHDVMGLAQTGTGKTAAFGLPLVQRLLDENLRPDPKTARCLVLAPTRELVQQIAENLRKYVKKTPIWVSSVVGGQAIGPQIKHLLRGTDILVATPGRLLDLVDRNAIQLDQARYLVLDEADQMLDLGFIHDLRKIAKLLATPRQTLLFSATMPPLVEEISKTYLTQPKRVEVAPPGKAADKIKQSLYFVHARGKADLLRTLLAEREGDLSLVFARTKHGAEKLMKTLVAHGFAAASIHGNKSQGQRDRALKAFKSGEVRILVATDVAARGIDIPGVTHVYNFNLPEVPENYVHRIGRTARAGRDGAAVAFCAPEERKLLRQVERLMGIDIPVAGDDGSDPESYSKEPTKRGKKGAGGNRNADGSLKKKRRPNRASNAGGKGNSAKPARPKPNAKPNAKPKPKPKPKAAGRPGKNRRRGGRGRAPSN
ncbi:MAG: DEAD/DEAH box helicase [Rhizobiaceae bacterium]|nr:DEAD/DEAH box helicase [Hyphomicrobiales bacterium]NRB30765.1 DEAD/DEAH box helicase [Rhizobiaceae bacterium]